MISTIEELLISPETSIGDAIACIDRNRKGIALIVDSDRWLLGTVTDGDIRRGILEHIGLDAPVGRLLEKRARSPYPKPVTAPEGTDRNEMIRIMLEAKIRQLVLLDEEGRVADLATLQDLMPESLLPVKAVVMAGGFGKRLQSLTKDTPKPMLPVGDRPVMEHIIDQLRQSGIRHVHVTTHFKPEKIVEHFGDGQNFGVDIEYVTEDMPLGTAGALGLMETPDQPLLVINGDVLTGVDFRALLRFHQKHEADLTVGVRQYELRVPYGVLECEGASVQRVHEKPIYKFFVNAGIYLLEPRVHDMVPSGEQFDMTDLIERLIIEGGKVVSFPIIEHWLDIGHPEDYRRAQEVHNHERQQH